MFSHMVSFWKDTVQCILWKPQIYLSKVKPTQSWVWRKPLLRDCRVGKTIASCFNKFIPMGFENCLCCSTQTHHRSPRTWQWRPGPAGRRVGTCRTGHGSLGCQCHRQGLVPGSRLGSPGGTRSVLSRPHRTSTAHPPGRRGSGRGP